MSKPDYGRRISRLRKSFLEEGLDAVLINSIKDLYYYTGNRIAKDDLGFLLVSKRASTLFVSTLNIGLEGPGVRVVESLGDVRKELGKHKNIGFDEKNMSVLLFRKLRTGKWKPFSRHIKAVRMVKDDYEVSVIRNACRNTLKVFSRLDIKGKKEFEVTREIRKMIIGMGDEPAFSPLVLAGRNSSFIHRLLSKSIIKRGLAVIDFGSCHEMYNSDLTRTFMLSPTRREKGIYETCQSMQKELISMAVPGTAFSEIQKRYEKLMKESGYRVMHGFGHGLGLSVHERPLRGDVLQKGMVLTVEPGIYVKGLGGCRIEDDVLVSDKPVVLSR